MAINLPHGLNALRSPRYRRYFAGQAVSILGTWIQTVAMSWLVYRLTGSAALLGLTAFLAQAPQLVVSPLAGLFIDRFDRRRLFLGVQALMIVQAVILALLVASGVVQTWHLITLAGVFGVLNSFDTPLRQTMLGQMVDDPAHLRSAIALNASLFNSARFIGPPLAGLILSLTSEALCFALNAASFLGVGLAVALLPSSPRKPATISLAGALKEGIRFALDTPAIRTLLAGVAIINLAGTAYAVLMPVMAKEVLGGDARTLGWLLGASGGGALISTGLVASRKDLGQLGRLISVGWMLAVLGLAGMAAASGLSVALLAAFALGVGISAINVSTNASLQSLSPESIRGRIVSYFTAFRFGMDALGGLAAGALAGGIGVQSVMAGQTVLVLIGCVWFWRRRDFLS